MSARGSDFVCPGRSGALVTKLTPSPPNRPASGGCFSVPVPVCPPSTALGTTRRSQGTEPICLGVNVLYLATAPRPCVRGGVPWKNPSLGAGGCPLAVTWPILPVVASPVKGMIEEEQHSARAFIGGIRLPDILPHHAPAPATPRPPAHNIPPPTRRKLQVPLWGAPPNAPGWRVVWCED